MCLTEEVGVNGDFFPLPGPFYVRVKTNKSVLKETGERDKYKERGDDQRSLLLIFVPLTIFPFPFFFPFPVVSLRGRFAPRLVVKM